MNRRPIASLPLALVACASWLFCIGPCALGPANFFAKAEAKSCAPSGCESCVDEPEPAEQGGGSPSCLATCQQLRIAVAPGSAKTPVWDGKAMGELAFTSPSPHAPAPVIIHRPALDTGPPFAWSFAELVLQKSLLSHAPPRAV